jgi:Glycosyl transferase family 2
MRSQGRDRVDWLAGRQTSLAVMIERVLPAAASQTDCAGPGLAKGVAAPERATGTLPLFRKGFQNSLYAIPARRCADEIPRAATRVVAESAAVEEFRCALHFEADVDGTGDAGRGHRRLVEPSQLWSTCCAAHGLQVALRSPDDARTRLPDDGDEPMSRPPAERPKVSVVVVVYNMAREAPRTLFSLSAAFQRNISAEEYEVIVVDNGSTPPFDAQVLAELPGDFRLIRIEPAPPSPAHAINRGLAAARGEVIGVMIDGARIASPGMLGLAAMAARLSDRFIALTLAFHLGPKTQMLSVPEGYDPHEEDRLLARSGWTEDGYRLFDISVFSGSSAGGWFRPLAESNAIFMRRPLWDELEGYDEKFASPGGGYVNLDTLRRAASLPDVSFVTLLGEGTFHQVHGGVATSGTPGVGETLHAEYVAIRGEPFRTPCYRSHYLGSIPPNVLKSIATSACAAGDEGDGR